MDVAADMLCDVSNQAKKAWYDMRRQFKLEDATLHHQVFMTFDDNWISFSLRYVVDIRERRITKDRLFTKLLEELDLHKEVIKLASATIEVVYSPTGPTLNKDL